MISVGLVVVLIATRLVTQGYTGSIVSGNTLYWLFAFVVTQVRDPTAAQHLSPKPVCRDAQLLTPVALCTRLC